jgi:hypothetical protein
MGATNPTSITGVCDNAREPQLRLKRTGSSFPFRLCRCCNRNSRVELP